MSNLNSYEHKENVHAERRARYDNCRSISEEKEESVLVGKNYCPIPPPALKHRDSSWPPQQDCLTA